MLNGFMVTQNKGAQTMKISLRPELERFVEDRAHELGYRTVEEYLNALIEREKSESAAARQARVERAIERMSGSADAAYSTDEIMALTRGDKKL
jgi:hypothetical protein